MNQNLILGASTWTKSLGEIDYLPGAYFDAAVAIIPGKKSFVQVVTLGVNGSFYYKPLAIMADQAAYPWQVCLFAGVAVGKRWR